jgi:molecular chaperone GrpE
MAQPAAGPPVTLDVLAGEISGLRDLFQRRLLNDQVQKRLFEEMHSQLDIANGKLVEAVLGPVLRQVVLVIDRIEHAGGQIGNRELVESIHLELTEILARQGVTRIDSVGHPFDPRCHQAIGVAEVDDPAEDGVVVANSRVGYLIQDRVLRPAEVEVGRCVTRPALPAATENGD